MWNRIGAVLNYQFSRLVNVDVDVRNSIRRYDDDDVALEADEDYTEAGIVLWRQVSRTLGILGVVRAVDYGYEEAATLERGFLSMFFGLGMEKQLSKDLRAGVRVGYQANDYDDASLDNQDAPYVIVHIKGAASPRVRLDGQIRYLTRDADVYPFSSQEYTGLAVGAEWDTSPRVTLLARLAYGLGEYTPEGTPSTATDFYDQASGDETTIVGALGVVYKISDTASLRLGYLYEDVDTDVSLPFTRNSGRLSYMKSF
jgi:hypothetical protein